MSCMCLKKAVFYVTFPWYACAPVELLLRQGCGHIHQPCDAFLPFFHPDVVCGSQLETLFFWFVKP